MFGRKNTTQGKKTGALQYADAIIANMIDSLIVVDPEGVIKTVNKATLDLLGYTEDELINQQVGMIFAEEEEEEEEEALFKGTRLRKLIAEGSVRDFDMTYLTKSGEKIPMSFNGAVMYETREAYLVKREAQAKNASRDTLHASRIIGIVCVARDMRQARRLFAVLKSRSDELSVLYDVTNALSYTLDQGKLIKLIMESMSKIVNYDICGALLFSADTANTFLKPAYPEATAFTDEIKAKLIATASTITGENIRAKKTDVVFLSPAMDAKPPSIREDKGLKSFFNVPFVAQGKTVGILSLGSCKEKAFGEEDVRILYTISNQASVALERLRMMVAAEKSKMESMVESMTEGVIMMDVRREIVVFNPKGREMLGFGLEEEVGNAKLLERLKTVRLDGTIKECWAEGKIVTKETTIPHGEENMILHADTVLVRDNQQNPVGVVMILRDVTKEREIDNMKTEFVSVVSHELRTPLAILKEGLTLVLDKVAGPINEKQEKFLGMAKSNIDRLTDIINNLLNVSRIEAGNFEIKKQLVDLADLIEKVISSFEPRAKEMGLKLKTSFPQGEICIYADADMMTQVFINLINNALKFTECGYIEVFAREKEDVVECMVADTGRGIAHNDLPKVFGKFQQFDRPAGGAGEKGTGLGLAITKGIIKSHKGKIWVESELNKGTKFIFTLPKYTAEEIFKEYINNGITGAVKKGTKVSLIVISIGELDKLIQELGRESLGLILRDMEGVLKNALRREGDVVVRDTGEVVVLLADCPKDNVEIVKKRLEQALEDYLTRPALAGKIKLHFGCATYPDEAQNDVELIEKAKCVSREA